MKISFLIIFTGFVIMFVEGSKIGFESTADVLDENGICKMKANYKDPNCIGTKALCVCIGSGDKPRCGIFDCVPNEESSKKDSTAAPEDNIAVNITRRDFQQIKNAMKNTFHKVVDKLLEKFGDYATMKIMNSVLKA